MKAIALTVAAALLLAACATPQPKMWQKEGATQEQFGRDKITCHQYGMQAVMASGLSNNMFAGIVVDDKAAECMRTLGYF